MNARAMKPLLALLAICALISSTQAATLAEYDFNGFSPTTEAMNVYPTLTRGNYVNQSTIRQPVDPDNFSLLVRTDLGYTNPWDGNVMEGRVRGLGSTFITTDDIAITRNAWFAITYTPEALTSFTSISLSAAVGVFDVGGEVEEVYETGMVLRSSLTGWTAGDALGSVLIEAGMDSGGRQQITFDLSGVSALQNVTGPVTFRFYMNTNGTSAAQSFFIDDLTVNGTQAVPEPATMLLLTIGGVAVLVMRRRTA